MSQNNAAFGIYSPFFAVYGSCTARPVFIFACNTFSGIFVAMQKTSI